MPVRDKLELEKLRAEISNLSAGTQKVYSEIRKLEREYALYPVVVGTTLVFAFVGLIKVLS